MINASKIPSRLVKEIKSAGRDLSGILGMNERLFRSARGARIMVYHGICTHDHTRFNNIFLRSDTFESHLRFYKKYFNIITLDDYYAGNFSDDRFNICITFDDGYANNYTHALPLLKKYDLKATFFITAIRDAGYDILWNDFLFMIGKYGPEKILYKGEIFRKMPFNRYVSVTRGNSLTALLRSSNFGPKAEMMKLLYPLVPFRENKPEEIYWMQMTPEQMGELAETANAAIGCHGYYHNDLTKITPKQAADELSISKLYLEKISGKQVNAVAFPYGEYSADVILASKRVGFTQLLALDYLSPADRADESIKERFIVNPFISVNNQMLCTIKGNYAD